jgi:serine protease Do
MNRLRAMAGAAGAVFLLAQGALAAEPPAAVPSLSDVVEHVMPSVVNVRVEMRRPGVPETGDPALDSLLKRFLNRKGSAPQQDDAPPPPEGEGGVTALGSGFIVDPAGLIATNDHLVESAGRIIVILHDNSRHRARIVGRDQGSDIALLKIDTSEPLPAVRWADSDHAKIGDWVIAVGNPYGLGGSVTAGIISGLGRSLDDGPYDDFLQIDAPINRGNSGGPTFDLDGRVLGINTAIFSPSGGSVGIGFAIPASFAKQVIEQLRTKGRVDHGWLGVSLQNLTPNIAPSFGLDPDNPAGAVVDDVAPDSPAARAGVRQGDVILTVDAHPVREAHDLVRIVGMAPVGSRVMLMLRRGGRNIAMPAMVGTAPPPPTLAAAEGEGAGSSEPPRGGPLGLDLQPLTPELRQRLAPPHAVDGVVVTEVRPASAGANLGLEPGDIIVSVDHKTVRSPEEASRRIEDGLAQGQILLLVNRHGGSHFLGANYERDRAAAKPSP